MMLLCAAPQDFWAFPLTRGLYPALTSRAGEGGSDVCQEGRQKKHRSLQEKSRIRESCCRQRFPSSRSSLWPNRIIWQGRSPDLKSLGRQLPCEASVGLESTIKFWLGLEKSFKSMPLVAYSAFSISRSESFSSQWQQITCRRSYNKGFWHFVHTHMHLLFKTIKMYKDQSP